MQDIKRKCHHCARAQATCFADFLICDMLPKESCIQKSWITQHNAFPENAPNRSFLSCLLPFSQTCQGISLHYGCLATIMSLWWISSLAMSVVERKSKPNEKLWKAQPDWSKEDHEEPPPPSLHPGIPLFYLFFFTENIFSGIFFPKRGTVAVLLCFLLFFFFFSPKEATVTVLLCFLPFLRLKVSQKASCCCASVLPYTLIYNNINNNIIYII